MTTSAPPPEAAPPSDLNPQERARRSAFEGRTVYTIKCDDCWHALRTCSKMDLFRSSFPVNELVVRDGVLLEKGVRFRYRWACPLCTKE